jgi:hypothetical protein
MVHGTLTASTTYTITVSGTALTSFVVITDLGSVLADSSWQAAPSA